MRTSLFYRLFYAKGNLSYLEATLEEISDMMSCIEGLEYTYIPTKKGTDYLQFYAGGWHILSKKDNTSNVQMC